MNDLLISIIIPVYNSSQTISRTLNSLLSQTYENIEILCINDGSSDNSLDIMAMFEKNDSRIKILTQVNSGPATARNYGLHIATGDYLMFCDSDDWYEPQMCELMLKTILEQNVDLVVCDVNQHIEGDHSRSLNYTTVDFLGYLELTDCNKKLIRKSLWNKIFKHSIIIDYNISFPAGYEHDDSAFIRQYVAVAKKNAYGVVNKLYNYTVRHGSLMWQQYNDIKKDKMFDCYSSVAFFFDFLTKHNMWNENVTYAKDEIWGAVSFHYWIVPEKYQNRLLEMYSDLLNRSDTKIPEMSDHQSQNLYLLKKRRYAEFIETLQNVSNMQKLFSIRNEGAYKVLRLFGFKIKFKRGKK